MELGIYKRVVILFVYSIIFYLVLWMLTGQWQLRAGNESLWYVSIVAYFTYDLIGSYYFVKTQDSFATAISTFLLFITVDISNLDSNLLWLRNVGIGLSIFVIIISLINIGTHKVKPKSAINNITYRISQYFGDGKVLFFPVLLFCSVAYYNNEKSYNINAIIWLNLFWMLVSLAKPLELICFFINKKGIKSNIIIGKVYRVDNPNIARVNIINDTEWENFNYVSRLSDKWIRIIPIDKQFQNDGILGTGIYCDWDGDKEIEPLKSINSGDVVRLNDCIPIKRIIFNDENNDITYAGFVIENSNINLINIELTTNIEIEEGYILVIKQNNKNVYYQIIDGITTEEMFLSNPQGKIIIKAYQLGCYSVENGFVRYTWVPSMNTPVFVVKNRIGSRKLDDNEIGLIPNSGMSIQVDLNDLVVYHTAILGITGTGKTELAFDIIRKNVHRGVKVVCVDFTGDYKIRLKDLNPTFIDLDEGICKKVEESIINAETGEFGGAKEKGKFYQCIKEVDPIVNKHIQDFINSDNCLAILELPGIANTRTSLKITEMYLSNLFLWAKNNRNEKLFQIVLEEAHTIIPEKNMYTYDKVDTESVLGRISQIALQGRKYGVGIMLISQRTALVSKTILSQCNTFFTFNLIDRTSLDFLSNVYSKEHIDSIKNLKKLQMLATGKALSSENPVIIEIPFDETKEYASKNIGTINIDESADLNSVKAAEL